MNYTEAAAQLNLTQPAVSIQLKQLEEHIGLPLVDKIGKKLFLTAAGIELKEFCTELFTRFDSLEMTLSAMKGKLEGEFKLAAVTSAKYFTPHLLGAFHKHYPNVNLHLDIVNREQIIQRLKHNKDDVVIMGLVPETMNLSSHPFVDNPITFVASPNHPLAKQKNISLKTLQNHNIIYREPGSGTRKAFEDYISTHNISIQPNMVLGSSETIKQAVMADLGIAALSRHSVTLELATQVLVELDIVGFPLVKSWYLVHHNDKKLSPIAQAFIEFVLAPEQNVAELCDRFLEKHFVVQ